jgi:hypothetical protein
MWHPPVAKATARSQDNAALVRRSPSFTGCPPSTSPPAEFGWLPRGDIPNTESYWQCGIRAGEPGHDLPRTSRSTTKRRLKAHSLRQGLPIELRLHTGKHHDHKIPSIPHSSLRTIPIRTVRSISPLRHRRDDFRISATSLKRSSNCSTAGPSASSPLHCTNADQEHTGRAGIHEAPNVLGYRGKLVRR